MSDNQVSANGIGEPDTAAINLGQDLDFELARAILLSMDKPIVVDIGVEHGSFTDLALQSRAGKVFAFEALPRHCDFLQSKYRDIANVTVFPLAVSDTSGTANFNIAVDSDGNELDYYHSLSSLDTTATVVRNSRSITVETASLSDLVQQGTLPREIDFLKVDTEGHDLMVLKGVGDLRPRIIVTEYWDSLPDTSGQNLYTLADLVRWGHSNGYKSTLVIRRQGAIETLEIGSSWTRPGDWGNIFFFRDAADLARIESDLLRLAGAAHETNARYVAKLERDGREKEEVITHLKSELAAARQKTPETWLSRVLPWIK